MLVHKETVAGLSDFPIAASGFSGLSQVCQMLRYEYLSFLLGNIKIIIYSESIAKMATHYDRKLKDCQASLCIFLEDCPTAHMELLPLLLLAIDVPSLKISFESSYDDCSNALGLGELKDMATLVEVARENSSWRDYLVYAIDAVTLHSPENRCAECEEGKPRNARLHIVFKKEQRELWMDGTHNFAQLRKLLAETGLGRMTAMDVRVGLTSLGNEGLGKGLRTEEEQQAIDWMLGRSKKRPSDIKRLPRMLQELGE
jgi:hypothetical protein